jgi:NitT/TauT family transport system substrate-binding protein
MRDWTRSTPRPGYAFVYRGRPDRQRKGVRPGGSPGSHDHPPVKIRHSQWRDYEPDDAIRFYALRLREAGMIKSNPNRIIAQGTDWRFFDELKRELKT